MPHVRLAGLAAVLAVLSVAAGCRSTGPAPDPVVAGPLTPDGVIPDPAVPEPVIRANATVEDVVDGDTIDVAIDGHEERVRLIGIDTPETKDEDAPIGCYGPEATALTELLLPAGAAVRLERDVEARDDYGRLLAYVHRSDGVFVNLELARQGAAVVLSIRPNTAYADPFATAVEEARRAGRGLWGACPGGA